MNKIIAMEDINKNSFYLYDGNKEENYLLLEGDGIHARNVELLLVDWSTECLA